MNFACRFRAHNRIVKLYPPSHEITEKQIMLGVYSIHLKNSDPLDIYLKFGHIYIYKLGFIKEKSGGLASNFSKSVVIGFHSQKSIQIATNQQRVSRC